jgi:octaprenyl-diphosphate synthase
VIRFKTAKLFEASARLGAVLARAPANVEEPAPTTAARLGTAFQLIDDLLDYEGDTHATRQERRRRPARRQADAAAADRDGARQRPASGADPPRDRARRERPLQEIVEIVRRTGALEATREAARAEADKARARRWRAADNPYREALLELCVRSVERSIFLTAMRVRFAQRAGRRIGV